MGLRSVVGFGRELARKWSSNSLASKSKEEMDDGLSRLYHIRARPLRVSRISPESRSDRAGAQEINWLGLSTRKLIRPSRGSGNELVRFKYSKADPTEKGLKK
ncbi:hypothetical protein B296_00047250 [Ensete ventricosum]|uniref:Uncharacterized protein n=1 Tax=Ensete ventricosum TaxID=4639 RepID=A0A426XCX2_ENSVE|nr:hypothetical protein B296_00047250 [Ensete ventricosum]